MSVAVLRRDIAVMDGLHRILKDIDEDLWWQDAQAEQCQTHTHRFTATYDDVQPSVPLWPLTEIAEQANPDGTIYVITDNLSSHNSKSTRVWLEDHPALLSGAENTYRVGLFAASIVPTGRVDLAAWLAAAPCR